MEKIGSFFIRVFLLVPFLLFSTIAMADVKVQATVDHNEVGVGQTFTVTVSVSSSESVNIGDLRLPSSPVFELLQQSEAMESRSAFVNGSFQFLRTKKFVYLYRAQQKGNFVFAAIDVPVEGKSYKTQPFTVKVADAGKARPQVDTQQNEEEMNDPFEQADQLFQQLLQRRGMHGGGSAPLKPINPNDAFSIQLAIDKTQAYVGEQITATWYLVIPEGNNISQIDTLKYPDLKGFWKEDIEVATNLNFQSIVVNGRPYRRAILVSYALFPIKEGQLTIDSYKAKCNIVGLSNFGSGGQMAFSKVSAPTTIKVLPLPLQGKPSDFTGAVGNFQIKSDVSGKTFPTNQPFSFKLRFEGSGNAKQIEKPNLNLPSTVEIYDTKEESKFFANGNSFKEFEYLLIPRQLGKLELPAVSTSFFNPKTAKYQSIRSQAVQVEVVQGRSEGAEKDSPLGILPVAKAPQADLKTLPGPYSTLLPAPKLNVVIKLQIYITIFVLAALIMMLWSWLKLRAITGRQLLLALLQQRMRKVTPFCEQKNPRMVGVELTNLVAAILGRLSGDGASQEMHLLLQQLPPSLSSMMNAELIPLMEIVSTLSFAPEEMLKEWKDTRRLSDLANQVKKVLQNGIQLSESTGAEPVGVTT